MTDPAADALFGSDLWAAALEKFAVATHLTVRLFDAGMRAVFGPVHPTPLFRLFEETGHDPGIFAECARRCLAQTGERPAVLVSQYHGLAVVGASLILKGEIVGAAVGGYAFADFSQVSEVQRLARQAGIVFERLWNIARKQAPVPRQRLLVHGELLQVLGDALLREHYRRRQYEQAAAIVNSSDAAIISKDLNGIITSWNRGAEQTFGYTAQEAIGRPVTLLMPPDRLDEEPGILERIRRGERIDHYETVRRRKDGTLLDVSLTVSPIVDPRGRIVGASKIARDISERKQQQRQRELLVNELNHRVKNTLAVVQSLAMQTLSHAASLAEGRSAFEARLLALARVHDMLTREHWEGANLNEIVAGAAAVHSGDARDPRFRVAGPRLHLRPKAALAMAMALNELATNAVKYGALSNGTGVVDVDWSVTQDNPQQFHLRWAESSGPPVAAPRRRGFGSRLIEQGLAHDLAGKARLTFAREGLVCAIEAPLDEIAGGGRMRAPAERS